MDTLFPNITISDDLPDRNCDRCVHWCTDYESWLQFQNCLYKVVRDPLFELAITLCIVLNTAFLAMEHHGMSESFRNALDVGNKVSVTFPTTRINLIFSCPQRSLRQFSRLSALSS